VGSLEVNGRKKGTVSSGMGSRTTQSDTQYGGHRKLDAEEPVGNDAWHPAFASVAAQPAPALGEEDGGLKQAPYRSWRSKGPDMDPTDNLNKRAKMHVFLTPLFLVVLAPLGCVLFARGPWWGARSKDG